MRVAITGASRGIGRALATRLAARGARLALVSLREEGAQALARALDPARTRCWALDLSQAEKVEEFVRRAQEFLGGLDALVVCHAVAHPLRTVAELDWKDIQRTFELNVFSPFHLVRQVLPVMRAQNEGRIVLLSSFAGRRAVPNLSAYSASKFAVRGLSEAVAKEVQGTNIRCCSVSPGGVRTDMRRDLFGEEDAAKQQSPDFIAEVIEKVLFEKILVPNGADVIIRKGGYRVQAPESEGALP